MKKLCCAVGTILITLGVGLSAQVSAQYKLAWDITAPSLADVQAYTWKYYEGANPGVALTGVTCVNFTPTTAGKYTCQTNFPAFTPTAHTITVKATNTAGEGPSSSPLSFTFVVVPDAATGLRSIPPGS